MRECSLWIIVWSIVQALKCFLVSNFYVVLGNEPGNWIPSVPIKNCAHYTYLSNIIPRPTEICLLLPWKQSECWHLIRAVLISTMSLDQFAAMIMWKKLCFRSVIFYTNKQANKYIYILEFILFHYFPFIFVEICTFTQIVQITILYESPKTISHAWNEEDKYIY